MAYGKKSVKDHFNAAGKKTKSFLRKVFMAALAVGAIGGAGYYEYGTVQEQDVKVVNFKNDTTWDSKANQNVGGYTFYTDKGDFVAEPSHFPFRPSQEDANAVYRVINSGNIYHITTYGKHLVGKWPSLNIIEARQVTEEEMKSKELDKAKAATLPKQPGQTVVPAAGGAQPTPVAGAQPMAATGEVVTYPVMVGGYRVQLTIPAEAVGRVTINNVTPPAAVAPTPVAASVCPPVQQYAPAPQYAPPAAPKAPLYDGYDAS